jgi:glutaredoxin-like YruB-family protein
LSDDKKASAKSEKKVIVYTTPSCIFCKHVKAYLDEKNIDFEEFDVLANPAKAQEMIDKSQQMGVPVTDIDGEIIVGFDRPKLEAALTA